MKAKVQKFAGPSEAISYLAALSDDTPITMPAGLARLLFHSHRHGLTRAQRAELDGMIAKLEGECLG